MATHHNRKELALDTFVFLLAVAINVILLNVIGARVSARADLTRDDVFTLAPGSVSILQGLEDDLTVSERDGRSEHCRPFTRDEVLKPLEAWFFGR